MSHKNFGPRKLGADSLVPQEKFWGPEKILSPEKRGSKTILDKKGFSLQKKMTTPSRKPRHTAEASLTV